MGGTAYGGRRVPREYIEDMAEGFTKSCMPKDVEYVLTGSFRRGKDDSGDIEIVFIADQKDWSNLNWALGNVFGWHTTVVGARHSGIYGQVQFDCFLTERHAMGAMLLHTTGSHLFNVTMRTRANKFNYKLNQYGLFHMVTGIPICISDNEEDFFKELGMDYVNPERRG